MPADQLAAPRERIQLNKRCLQIKQQQTLSQAPIATSTVKFYVEEVFHIEGVPGYLLEELEETYWIRHA